MKDFGPTTRALDNLDLDIESGEVHGFLGPNGAGKTTTIRVAPGLLRADAGHVALLGHQSPFIEPHSRTSSRTELAFRTASPGSGCITCGEVPPACSASCQHEATRSPHRTMSTASMLPKDEPGGPGPPCS